MSRGCVAGLVTRWTWFAYPDFPVPEVDDIAIRATGSCYRVVSMKPSRKGPRWYTMHVEGLGLDAADLDDEGTFAAVSLRSEDYEAIRLIEAAERLDADRS